MKPLIQWACLRTVQIFYKRIQVTGRNFVPHQGPIMVVANHPNGLLDPGLVWLGLNLKVGFLAKSTLFDNPVGKVTMEAFGAIPVYRSQDDNDTSLNDKTFELCIERFGAGGSIVIFPEGVSHSDSKMRRLKTGAARIALQSADAHPDVDLMILPVGLFYEAKEVFRSRVSLAVGEPIRVNDYLEAFRAEGFEAATELTKQIDEAFGGLVLQADTTEIWDGLVAVARWTDEVAAYDVEVARARAQELSQAYQRMLAADPEHAESLIDEVQSFAHLLRSIGVDDPWDVEPPTSVNRLFLGALTLALWSPAALVGVLSSWPLYRALRPIAVKMAGTERDIISTLKAILGMVFLPVLWVSEAVILGYFVHWIVGLLALFVLPACGYVAMRFGELVVARREILKAYWIGATRSDVQAEIRLRQEELAGRIETALEAYR